MSSGQDVTAQVASRVACRVAYQVASPSTDGTADGYNGGDNDESSVSSGEDVTVVLTAKKVTSPLTDEPEDMTTETTATFETLKAFKPRKRIEAYDSETSDVSEQDVVF